ncbi:MAG: glycoside hydrolase family 27 protein [Janthinobacterium lividum]
MQNFSLSIVKTGLLAALALLGAGAAQAQKFTQLAQTPPMGWNSWNKFACDVDEQKIRGVADAMAANGMKAAGYEYLVIDDCWHGKRDTLGFIQPDAKRFPGGMKALVDYVHSKGLKFGIYSDAGATTCGGRPGSRGHEYQDALTYAQWGVDYLKYDWCATDGLKAEGAYTTMRNALGQAGHPVVFSLCEWGTAKPWLWAQNVGHLWRTTGDIYNCWDCVHDNGGDSKSFGVLRILDQQAGLRQYAGPGHWNDPDMMEVGNGKLTPSEDRAHFSMWCMVAAPLIAGNDLRQMSPATKAVLTNQAVIAVDQDPLGVQGFRLATKDSVDTWVKPLQGGDWAVCFLNRAKGARAAAFDWKTQPVHDEVAKRDLNADRTRYKIRNLWTGQAQGTTAQPFRAPVAGHDVVLLRLTQ